MTVWASASPSTWRRRSSRRRAASERWSDRCGHESREPRPPHSRLRSESRRPGVHTLGCRHLPHPRQSWGNRPAHVTVPARDRSGAVPTQLLLPSVINSQLVACTTDQNGCCEIGSTRTRSAWSPPAGFSQSVARNATGSFVQGGAAWVPSGPLNVRCPVRMIFRRCACERAVVAIGAALQQKILIPLCPISAIRLLGPRTGEVRSSLPLLSGTSDNTSRLGEDEITVDGYVSLIWASLCHALACPQVQGNVRRNAHQSQISWPGNGPRQLRPRVTGPIHR